MSASSTSRPRIGPGTCAMRGSCGKTSMFGADLPCPDDGPANSTSDAIRDLMSTVCGPAYTIPSSVCCTLPQLDTLQDKMQQVAPLIASCPACINNFRAFYCDFTCSPDQSTFLHIASTQKTTSGRQAVKEVEYLVSDEFKQGFYDSCKSVQFGATNGFAMDLIGGGAKDASAFLKYMGDERPGLGSPFQISFPERETGYDRVPLGCADDDINAKCACADCPTTCPTLPYIAPPSANTCTVGAVSCLTFSLLIIYSVCILVGLLYFSWKQALRHRQRRYERVALLDPPMSPGVNGHGSTPHNGLDGLVGRGDDAESGPSGSIHFRLGRGASLLDPMDHVQPKQNRINAALRRSFYRLGLWCASRPLETFGIAALVVGLLNIGWKSFAVETEPVRLWVAPGSEAASQKHFFDEKFGPFYRAEQIFVSSEDGQTPLTRDNLEWWLGVERDIASLKSDSGVTLNDVCFKPSGPDTACVVQSISAWLGDDMAQWGDDWAERVDSCAHRPGECLPDFGQPIDPKIILGAAQGNWLEAKALVTTYVVDNYNDDRVRPAEEWERSLETYLRSLHRDGLRISFSTGVSLEEELNKSTNTDVKIVVLSYLVMFVYVSLTLGGGLPPSVLSATARYIWRGIHSLGVLFKLARPSDQPPPPSPLAYIPTLLSVNSRFSLGLFGIAIVLVAVSSSVGFFSLMGVRVTLIIAEVIPFLVLAVGVDNVFILVHELDRQNALHAQEPSPTQGVDEEDEPDEPAPSLPAEERVARAVARMGPSIMLSSVTEVVAFGLGALVPMPAVRNFAIYAAGSVLFGALLQVTVFVSAMALDLRRAEPVGLYDRAPAAEGVVAKFMRKVYAPILLHREVKQFVLALFGGIFLFSLVGIQHIKLGLDQRLALPAESYLVPYFNDVDAYLDVGPPVYFVVTNEPVSRDGQQQLCGRFTTCRELSVANTLEAERKRPEVSYIASPPASWIDDFMQWTNPTFESCCRVRKANATVFCSPRDSERACRPCFAGEQWSSTMDGLPEGAEFRRYLDQWLVSPSDQDCPLGGMAPYSHAIALDTDAARPDVVSSHFRAYHTPLKTQDDFISALASARRIARDISQRTGTKVFPYSLFYVFFDQYAHVVSTAIEVLALALGAILVITSVLLGSWRTGAVITFTCALAVTAVAGMMGVWGVSLNALSLVNLVISLGIAVEFCSHLARAFMGAAGAGAGGGVGGGAGGASAGAGAVGLGGTWEKGEGRERDERAFTALVEVGPSVFSGITMTKLIGISVLALTRSKLLETYYFRMWLSLILSGALHGLVFLPVLLSYVGGPGYALEDTDEEWVTSQMRRPMDYEYAPFADTDSVVSDR